MQRVFDFLFSLAGILFLWPIGLILYVVGLFDTGKPIFVQVRVGKGKKPFSLYKFRTMTVNTKQVATHLSDSSAITGFGKFLRRTKLDELPQLMNVLKGDMSIVGPRPNLFNQTELIEERSARGVYDYRPGITGLAQINEIDMSTPQLLAETDAEMMQNLDLMNYFKFILATISGKGQGDRIKKPG